MRLAQMIRLWCKVNDVEYARLAEGWRASPSTVTRFLADERMPNGPTMARVIAWLLDDEAEPEPVQFLDDGFGNTWKRCGPECELEIVRPGKVQCGREQCPYRILDPLPDAAQESK